MAMALVDMAASFFNVFKLLQFFYGNSDITCKIRGTSSRIGIFTSLLLTVMIAFYRHRAICYPFSRQWSVKSSILVSFGCFLLAVVISAPIAYFGHAYYLGPRLLICDLYGQIELVANIYSSGQAAIYLISCTTVVGLYSKIFLVIRASQKVRKTVLGGQRGTGTNVKLAGNELSSSSLSASGINTSVSVVMTNINVSDQNNLVTQNNAAHSCVNPGYELEEKHNDRMNVSKDKTVSNGLNDLSVSHSNIDGKNENASRATREKTVAKPSSNTGEHRVTLMLLVITAVLLITWLPTVAYNYLTTIQLIKIHQQTIGGPITYLLLQLKYITHFTNFFIYMAINRKFRQECYNLLSCKK
nr:uncharacterized protein LOC129255483 [Lytechinus pictus]